MSERTHHIIDAHHLATVPDGTIITWLRIPGDHTSEAVAFVRREAWHVPGTDQTGVEVWISPGGWEPQTIESAGVSFPCRVVRWGNLASEIILGGEVPALVETLESGGTWARQAALDAAARLGAGNAVNRHPRWVDADRVITDAERFLAWLDADTEPNTGGRTQQDSYEAGYRDGGSSAMNDLDLSIEALGELAIDQAPALGELATALRQLKGVGVTREALMYVVDRVWIQ